MLPGYKTYITGGISLLIGLAGMLGMLPEALHVADPMLLITTGFGIIFLRNAIPAAK